MSTHDRQLIRYFDYIDAEDEHIVRLVQDFCVELAEDQAAGNDWTEEEAAHVAELFNQSESPYDLFRFVDERTGSTQVGYRRNGKEWFHILRQMRNKRDSGLLEDIDFDKGRGRYL